MSLLSVLISALLIKEGGVESTLEWDACKIDGSVSKHAKAYKVLPIAPDQEFDMGFLKHFKFSDYKKEHFSWRNDEQVDKVCYKEAETFLTLYNTMDDIKLSSKREKDITLILDMDETFFNRPLDTSRGRRIEFINPKGETEVHYVKARPHLKAFLQFVSKHADLFVWTMSTYSRTDTILKEFGLRHYFKQLITHRDVTKDVELPKVHIKAIQKAFDRHSNFHNVLHIDDRPGTFLLNQLNGLRIRKFESEDTDTQLIEFKKILSWTFRCFDSTGDIRDCVSLLKSGNPGYFDGLLPNEYVEPTEDEYKDKKSIPKIDSDESLESAYHGAVSNVQGMTYVRSEETIKRETPKSRFFRESMKGRDEEKE